MFKKAVYGITTIILLCGSCQDKIKNCLEANVEIRNESLKGAILEYDSIIRNDPKYSVNISNRNYLLTIYEKQINDSVVNFSISFSIDTWLMQDEPVRVAQVSDKVTIQR